MIRLILLGISSFAVSKFIKIPSVTLPLSATISLALLLDNKKSDASVISASSIVGNAMNIGKRSPVCEIFELFDNKIFHNKILINKELLLTLAKEAVNKEKTICIFIGGNTSFNFAKDIAIMFQSNNIKFQDNSPLKLLDRND